DTGMGLERSATILQGVTSAYETDLFAPALRRLAEVAPVGVAGDPTAELQARRRVVDHARAALLIWLAGVEPGRGGRGWVLRRMIGRGARQGRVLGLEHPFLGELVAPLLEGHGALIALGERERLPALMGVLADEEQRFSRLLPAGLRYLDRLAPEADG